MKLKSFMSCWLKQLFSKIRSLLDEESVKSIIRLSGGDPYFIQFICREAFDAWIRQRRESLEPSVPVDEIERKLDSDFFAGRWERVTDRQRALLFVIAHLDNSDSEFSVQEIVEMSKKILTKSFRLRTH